MAKKYRFIDKRDYDLDRPHAIKACLPHLPYGFTLPHSSYGKPTEPQKERSPERLLLVASVAARLAWYGPGCTSPDRARRARKRTRCSAACPPTSLPRPTAATRHCSSALLPAPDAPSSASSTFLSPPSSYGFFSGSILAKSKRSWASPRAQSSQAGGSGRRISEAATPRRSRP